MGAIQQINLIRNVSRFDNCSTDVSCEFQKVTLVYGENGRGKTTLCAVLRSLSSGDAEPVEERVRLGSSHPPHVIITLNDGTPCIYKDGAWSTTNPEIVVFDDFFVDSNVHSGLSVGAAHRHNLHEVIIGRQGVDLARRVEALTAEISERQGALRDSAALISTDKRGSLSVDEFCALPKLPDIDEKIAEAERRLAAIRNADFIREAETFRPVGLPEVDRQGIAAVLSEQLTDLDEKAAEAVKVHLMELGEGGEAWVARGVELEKRVEGCPFCSQSMEGLSLLAHYRGFFGEAYAVLSERVRGTLESFRQLVSGDSLARVIRQVDEVKGLRAFWSQYAKLPEFGFDVGAVEKVWKDVRLLVGQELEKKRETPLADIQLSEEAEGAVLALGRLSVALGEEITALIECNSELERVKQDTAEADVGTAEADVARLQAMRSRYEPEMVALCDQYLSARADKESAEREKEAARGALDRHRRDIIPRYEGAINEILRNFNADFRVRRIQATNPRGTPSSTYHLEINSHEVDIGQQGGPSFRSTLSAGDRNTLGLAFYFAQLELDADVGQVVAVIDDPVSSLDSSRTITTAQTIRKLAGKCKQLILMSHANGVLCQVWEGLTERGKTGLEVRRTGEGSDITPWDVNAASESEHDRRHSLLRDFIAGDAVDPRDVAPALRIVLETFLRVAYPEHAPPGTKIGPFVTGCRQKLCTAAEILNVEDVEELDSLRDYANRFHHDSSSSYLSNISSVDGQELLGFAKRAIAFTRRKRA